MARIEAMTKKIDARYKEMQSRSNHSIPAYDKDDKPMSPEAEAKFMQTFRHTRFYNDYLDRDSTSDNWHLSGRNGYNQDNYRYNSDDKPDLQGQLSKFIKAQHSTSSFVKDMFMDLKTKLETTTKNHQASIQNLEAKFDRFADKQSRQSTGSLPSNTQPNPKGQKGTKNVATDHLSRIDNDETSDESDVDDNFSGKTLMEITTKDIPWFADYANYLTITLAKHIIVAEAENCAPMLEKSMYDSWASCTCLFIKGKKHGRMMLDSIDNGPLVYPTVEENGQTRPKKYFELTEAQQLQDDCDVQATNIILYGLPLDVYALVNHQEATKDIWDRVKLLMKGIALSYEERECRLNKLFDKFAYV
nr:DNA-directed DNA polymerase [Tanacetum cinerariifolium]